MVHTNGQGAVGPYRACRFHKGNAASLLARVAADGGRARGSITICVPDREGGREIDVLLPRVWPVTPQVKGALRSMAGVVLVEDL
ncbi:MAG: hypothetical protein INF92_16430 [Rhodobacter sp.]|nr:hypothetical protein [Rhodobacter sp.]